MSKELIVSAGRHETRVGILEDDQLVEIFHEREKEYSLAGSIHKGRVTRVLPGMQSAFVDIGLERDAFLYVSDFFEDNEEYDAVVSGVEEKVLKLDKRPAIAEPQADEAAAPADSAAVAAVAAPVSSVDRPQQDRGERGPDRDRGGRGRRGRRRRGGRSGGLPESKFASAREADETADEETVTVDAVAEETESVIILPGESLAKYSAPDAEPEFEPEPEPEPEPESEGMAEAPQPEARHEEPAVAAVSKPEPEPEPEPQHIEAALPHEHPLAAFGEVAAIPEPMAAVEEHEAAAPEPDSAESEAEVGSEGEAEMAVESDVPAVAEDEGPEPARIPTSLTATLREQGHRYPHRVSRRMRRKMRGERGDRNNEPRPAAEGAAPQAEETQTVETAAAPVTEQRPQREERGDRGGRGNREDRGGRGRGDRNGRERNDRERGERPESSERGSDRNTDRSSDRNTDRAERPERERPPLPSIADLLKEGQEIIVQIAKEPLGQKGARITSHIALPGRFLVYMPTVDHAGVSRKIPSDEERQRLKRIVQAQRQGIPGGFICRTAAEGKTEEELKSDMHFLYNLWLDMRSKAEKKPAPQLLHHDLDLVQRILRDQLTASFKNIWVDSEELYESVLRFAQRFQPALVSRVKLYTRANPIFDEFGITQELEKALRPKVWLKSGGYIVINQTEALVAIDINTGKYVGKSNRLEDTIVKINTDAIKEIVRQIRLRDLGGIIVVDFIDMDERRNRQKVMQALEESMRSDRAPYKILQFNDFGLVAITRKRVKQSLERTLCAPCPYCEGAGYVKSVNTVITEILQESVRMRKAVASEHSNLVLRVNPEVARVLKSNQNQFLQEIEETLGKSVLVKSDPLLHQTKFDLA